VLAKIAIHRAMGGEEFIEQFFDFALQRAFVGGD
jgi:hypothetical protein